MLYLLLILVFQYSEEKHEFQKTLSNLRQEYRSMKNDNYLKEEMLRNKTIECVSLKDHSNYLERKQSRGCEGSKVVLKCKPRTGKEGTLDKELHDSVLFLLQKI